MFQSQDDALFSVLPGNSRRRPLSSSVSPGAAGWEENRLRVASCWPSFCFRRRAAVSPHHPLGSHITDLTQAQLGLMINQRALFFISLLVKSVIKSLIGARIILSHDQMCERCGIKLRWKSVLNKIELLGAKAEQQRGRVMWGKANPNVSKLAFEVVEYFHPKDLNRESSFIWQCSKGDQVSHYNLPSGVDWDAVGLFDDES